MDDPEEVRKIARWILELTGSPSASAVPGILARLGTVLKVQAEDLARARRVFHAAMDGDLPAGLWLNDNKATVRHALIKANTIELDQRGEINRSGPINRAAEQLRRQIPPAA